MFKCQFSLALLMATGLSVGAHADNTIAIGDTSRVYDIDEVLVINQPKEVYRLRQQPLSSTSFDGSQLQQLCLNMEVVTLPLFICVVSAHG